MQLMFYVYVLYSDKFDRIYIGQTNNIDARRQKHNSGQVTPTKAFIPWRMIYCEIRHSRAATMKRE
ncbi:MAG: GIY-YIG nuclease family protein [Fidelibacterota bacterium]